MNEALNRWRTATYRLRGSRLAISVRHHPSPDGTPSVDLWVLREIFRDGAYRIPAAVKLPAAPTIVDLGAHTGLFTAFIFDRYPRARVTAFEPDRDNARLLRETVDRNGYGERFALHEACAMPRNGPVRFAADRFQFSHIAGDSDDPAVVVPGIDVFPFLRDADLVKMDIEGAEWRLLADPRFAGPRAVVLEYHPMMSPSTDPRAAVESLLEERGYEIVVDAEPVVWAVRAEPTGARGDASSSPSS